jgi:hypothetical protein
MYGKWCSERRKEKKIIYCVHKCQGQKRKIRKEFKESSIPCMSRKWIHYIHVYKTTSIQEEKVRKRGTTVVIKVCRSLTSPEAGISKKYSATNSGSPKVELRFCPWLCPFYVYTVKKGYRPQPGCHQPNSPWRGIIFFCIFFWRARM